MDKLGPNGVFFRGEVSAPPPPPPLGDPKKKVLESHMAFCSRSPLVIVICKVSFQIAISEHLKFKIFWGSPGHADPPPKCVFEVYRILHQVHFAPPPSKPKISILPPLGEFSIKKKTLPNMGDSGWGDHESVNLIKAGGGCSVMGNCRV